MTTDHPELVEGRVILIVLDSVGVGELPDAADYGDAGSNTLAHIAEEGDASLFLANLAALGLGNIAPISPRVGAINPPVGAGLEVPPQQVVGCYGKMAELSKGKDTDTGHWEMMGIITERAFPTYPHGFPDDVIRDFENRIGLEVLGNKPASGTVIIQELGEEHVRTGRPIVYTSADSVFQIACHEEVIPLDELYNMCRTAREMLTGPHNVQRVIARPFIGTPGAFVRTGSRRDFSLAPPSDTLLDHITRAGGEVIGIGKIEDIFSGRGITTANHTTTNPDSIAATISAIESDHGTLIFTNLVDFDMLYGHRNDPVGYARSLMEFDAALPRIISALRDTDILIITADHGCDPTTPSTDHSREYVPLLVYGNRIAHGVDLGTRSTFSDIAATLAELFAVPSDLPGTSFLDMLSPEIRNR